MAWLPFAARVKFTGVSYYGVGCMCQESLASPRGQAIRKGAALAEREVRLLPLRRSDNAIAVVEINNEMAFPHLASTLGTTLAV